MSGDSGVYLGTTRAGDARSSPERSVLVIGPSRSGKTSSLIIPNLLITDRAVVATSTKDDVVGHLSRARHDRVTLLFDPSGTVPAPPGVRRVGYSPLRAARQWDGAVLATRSLVETARRGFGERADDHWTERAAALVAPLMHAAALEGLTMPGLSTRVDQRRGEESLEQLRERYGELHPAPALLAGVLACEERERSSIWSTAAGLFAGLRTEAARAASREAPLDVGEFLDGGHHLHVVSPSRHQSVSAPLIVGLIDELVEATYAGHRDGRRLLLALDELANVAPLPRLASIVSEGGGQGVVTLACLQDLSQARARWGTAGEGFLSLFATTVVLPGVADRTTLELLQRLAGKERTPNHALQLDHRGRPRGRTTSWNERDRVSVAEIAQGRPGHALALDEARRPHWVSLTPAHRDERFAHRLERPRSGPDLSSRGL